MSELLEKIRCQILEKSKRDSSPDGQPKKAFLGDLGHFCDATTEYRRTHDGSARTGMADRAPRFHVTHGTKDTLLQYLQDGLEVPYWKMMLEFFSTFRVNETTLGSDAVALAIISIRSEVYKARRQLDATVMASTKSEDIDGLTRGIDKRIAVLSSFTDSLVNDTDEEDEPTEAIEPQLVRRSTARIREEEASTTASEQDQGKSDTSPEAQTPTLRKPTAPASTQLNSILAALSLVAIIAGMVPFVEGFRIARDSSELGKKQDADYWFNICSGLTVIFSNIAMVLPLWKGSWAIKTHIITALWVITSVACAVASMAIYVDQNTAWSSLLAFFATVAGFGATLSITMTEEKAGLEEMGSDSESKKDR